MNLFGSIGRAPLNHATPAQAAAARVASARRNTYWREIDDDLAPRPPRYLVSASTDLAYKPYRGAVFGRAGTVEFADDRELVYVVRDGDVVMLEPTGETWSEILARRLARRAGAR